MSASRPYSVGSGLTRNTFNMGFRNLTTMDFGRIQPIVVQEAVPNDDINLNMAECVATLAPTAAPLQGKFIMHAAAFFVPNRVVWKEFNKYITGQSNAAIPSTDINSFIDNCLTSAGPSGYTYRDKIAYLTSFGLNPYKHYQDERMNVLCLRAYLRVWWDWFRDANVIPDSNETSYIFDGAVSANELTQFANRGLMYSTWYHQFVTSTLKTPNGDSRGLGSTQTLIDNQSALTTMSSASGGYAQPTSTPTSDTYMNSRVQVYQPSGAASANTINSLRAANALQGWLEKCNILGYRLRDRLRGMFGSSVSAITLQMSEYLGRSEFVINNDSEVSNQSTGQDSETDFTPFGTTDPSKSSMAGQLHGKTSMTTNGLGNIKYHASEHGYFMVLAWCLPDVMLTDGIPPHLQRGVSGPAPSRFDFLTPEMVNIGFEPLYYKEFVTLPKGASASGEAGTFAPNNVLGWRGRYENYKYNRDYLGGSFVDKNSSLSMKPWVLNRDFFDEQGIAVNPDGSYTKTSVPIGTRIMNNVNHDTVSQTWGAMFLGDSKFMITNSSVDHIVTQWKVDLEITRPLPAVVAPRIELVSAQPVMNGGTHL